MEIKQPQNNPYLAYLPSLNRIPDGQRGRLPDSQSQERKPRPEETIYLRQEDLTVLPADHQQGPHVAYDGSGRVVQAAPSANPVRKGVLIDVRA